jgi:hypothetical protein
LRGSLNAVRLVKSQRWVWDKLREACASLESDYARHREPGHWELVAVAFVASKQIDIQPFWDGAAEDLWRECGFKEKPPYMRVWRRLRELETVCEAFLAAAGVVIRRARAHDERIMAHVHFDFTEDETHAALIHDCQPGEPCRRKVITTRSGRRRAAPGSALHPARVATAVARQEREKWNAEDSAESEKHAKESSPADDKRDLRDGRGVRRVLMGGCWYRTRDAEAGIRAYTANGRTRRFWHGYYSGKAVCHLTGGAIPTVSSASTQEYDLFPALYDTACALSGSAPETAIGDKGFSIAKCFEHATKNGTAPVFPWRNGGGDRKRHDQETHDRHGVMRCKGCGGPMSQVRFSKNGGKPRLWFRCMLGVTPECAKDQTISCAQDWKALVPLARTEALYHELKVSHGTYEGVHDYWRDRYKVAADELGVRPKVVSIEWHRLRANVACLIDWLRIASKNGWLGSARTARREGQRRFKEAGQGIAGRLAEMRVTMGLAQPYGPKAVLLGLGKETPPSRRPRRAPPPPP